MENKNVFLLCKVVVFCMILTALAGFGGCSSDKNKKNMLGGAAIGALLGGGIGAGLASSAVGSTTTSVATGTVIGAGGGAVVGAGIGANATKSCSGASCSTKKTQKINKNK